jgi:hypothetical protein
LLRNTVAVDERQARRSRACSWCGFRHGHRRALASLACGSALAALACAAAIARARAGVVAAALVAVGVTVATGLALASASLAAGPAGDPRSLRSRARAERPDVAQIAGRIRERFAPILGEDGVDVKRGISGGVRVRMSVAPAHDRRARRRAWSGRETRRILARLTEMMSQEFPDVAVLPSSGIEVEDPEGGSPRMETIAGAARPAAVRTGGLEARLGAPAASASPAPRPRERSERSPMAVAEAAPAASPAPPGLADEQVEAMPPAGAGVVPEGAGRTAPAATGSVPGDAGPDPALRDAALPRFPPQPGGFGWRPAHLPGSGASELTTTTAYHHPRDAGGLEYLVEREVATAIQTTFKDVRVHARMIRPQVVRLDIEIAMHGHLQENLLQILHFTRDVTRVVVKERFNLLRIHHRSRIRVTEADSRFTLDYRFHELTPYGARDRGDDHPVFRRLRMERASVIDVPRAYALGRDASAFSVAGGTRNVHAGEYSNASAIDSSWGTLGVRRGFFHGLEAGLAFHFYSSDATPVPGRSFASPSDDLDVLTFAAKYLLPYELSGFALAVGLTHSFQQGAERKFYVVDDFERFYGIWVAGSRRILDTLLVHVTAKRTPIPQRPDFADNGINGLGLGFEYLIRNAAILMLELELEQFDSPVLAQIGTIQTGDGLNVNAGAVIGTRLGDVEVAARKLTVPEHKELRLGFAYHW